MSRTLDPSPQPRHRELPEMRASAMAKADLPQAERDDAAWREAVGRAIERTRTLSGLLLKEFADAVGRDVRQVGRWETGQERPQFDAIFADARLRQPLVQALSELAGADVEVVVTLRRRA